MVFGKVPGVHAQGAVDPFAFDNAPQFPSIASAIIPSPYAGGILVAECTIEQYCFELMEDVNGNFIPGSGPPSPWSYTLTASDFSHVGTTEALVNVTPDNGGYPGVFPHKR
jgi:hypothetical protein